MSDRIEPGRRVCTRQLYRHIARGVIYGVVETGDGQADTFLTRIDGAGLDIRIVPSEEFCWLTDAGCSDENRFELIPAAVDPYAPSRLIYRYSQRGQRRNAENFRLIEPLVRRDSCEDRLVFRQLLRSRRERARALTARANAAQVSRKTIYRLFRLFLQRGMRVDSVSCAWPNCGRPDGSKILHSGDIATPVARDGRPDW